MSSKPRVIAAEIKKDFSKDVFQERSGSKPHIAGELALVGGTSSEPHWVEVREGHLVVYPGTTPRTAPVWRLPLRHLNLQPAASGRPRGFSLSRHGELTPIATFQVDNELDYSRWVKTLAAELLKQTPLEAVKYLDILGITASIPQDTSPQRSLSPECYSEPDTRSWGYSPLVRVSPEPISVARTAPRNWFHKPLEVAQPLSLIITEEPKPRPRRTLSYDSSPEDCPDSRLRMVDTLAHLAKQSTTCFPRCTKSTSSDNVHNTSSPEEFTSKNRVKSLLKAFQDQRSIKEATNESSLHPLEIKDDGRTGRPPLPDVVKDLPPCERRSRARTRTPTPQRMRGKSLDVVPNTEHSQVAELIARCQQSDSFSARYVPVRDKRLLFESLGRTSSQPRFVLSSDNLTSLSLGLNDPPLPEPPRTQSLHDLSGNNVAVKEICRYFEQRGGSRGELTTRSPSPECRLRLNPPPPPPGCVSAKPIGDTLRRRQAARAERRLIRLRHNIVESEQTIWRLQEQSDKLSQSRRGSSTRIQLAVEARLAEERDRLKRLQEERFTTQQEVDSSTDHFGISATKIRHHSNVR